MRKINYHDEKPSPSFSIVKHLPIDLGLEIRSARKRNFMTQQEVADEIDISVKLYQKYEYNVCRPPLETIFKIFNLLGISAYELQLKLKSSSALSALNSEFNKFSTEEFLHKLANNPQLFKVHEALLQIECPECLEIISKINFTLTSFDKIQLKRKLILLKKIVE